MNFKKAFLLVPLLCMVINCKTQIQEPLSIKEALVAHSYEDTDAAIEYYIQLKQEDEDAYNFQDENELNNLGYQLMEDGRIDDAIKIFELLVAEFPDSFNPYDSLGEAYFLNGNTAIAVENYKRSLELNPENENAERFILNIAFENRDKNKFYKVYSKQDYLHDIDELAKTLTTANPHPYKFMAKDDFWHVVKEKKQLITDSTTYGEFIWHCSELVANINCGHSGIPMYFEQESEMLPDNLRFPMELLNIEGKLYVVNALVNNKKVKVGSELESINGKPSAQIIQDINKHISSQGKSRNAAKRHLFNWRSTAMIPYSLGFPKKYEVTVRGQREPVTLNMLDTYEFQLKNLDTCKETLCLDFIGDYKDIAHVTIHHWDFYGRRFSIMKQFLDKSFKEIKDKNTQDLIIDVRGNGGGNSWGAAYLLQYLAKKPFTYFKEAPSNSEKLKPLNPFDNNYQGNVYFLTDGRAGSTTGQLLALAKHHNIGTIIGEESNGGIFYTGGQKMFRLTNTDVFYKIGRYTHVTNANSISEDGGVFPNHHSVQTIEDYLSDIDTALEYTLKLIKTNKQN